MASNRAKRPAAPWGGAADQVLLVSVRSHQAGYFQLLANHRGRGTSWVDGRGVAVGRRGDLPVGLLPELERIARLRAEELLVRGRSSLGARIGRRLELATCRGTTLGLGAACLRLLEASPVGCIGLWNGGQWRTSILRAVARHLGRRTLFFENGLLPGTTTVDPRGVNAGSSIPRTAAFYRERGVAAGAGTGAGTGTGVQLVPRESRRGPGEASTDLPERFLLVPFQIESDTQVMEHSPWIRDMESLVRILIEAREAAGPSAPTLVFREHPSCRSSSPSLRARALAAGALFANSNPMQELLERAQGVVTLNSTVGIEALLCGCPVLALGVAVYAVPGIASSARSGEEVARWIRGVDRTAAPLAPAFLDYLAREYCVPGDWRDPDAVHLDAVSARIDACLDRQPFLDTTTEVALP